MRGFQIKTQATELGEATAMAGTLDSSCTADSLGAKRPTGGSVSPECPKC